VQVQGTEDVKTGRMLTLTLEADRASDEILLSELYQCFNPDSERIIMIIGVRDQPDKVFQWIPDFEEDGEQ